jgi:hypothetical protein
MLPQLLIGYLIYNTGKTIIDKLEEEQNKNNKKQKRLNKKK